MHAKLPKFGAFKCLIVFNLAAIIGFIVGTASFTTSMFLSNNSTFAWLLGNCIGGLSHFSANYFMQRQTKEKIVKNFVVFNATGIAGFLVASAVFASSIIFIRDSNASWILGSIAGTSAHYLLNIKAMQAIQKLKI